MLSACKGSLKDTAGFYPMCIFAQEPHFCKITLALTDRLIDVIRSSTNRYLRTRLLATHASRSCSTVQRDFDGIRMN